MQLRSGRIMVNGSFNKTVTGKKRKLKSNDCLGDEIEDDGEPQQKRRKTCGNKSKNSEPTKASNKLKNKNKKVKKKKNNYNYNTTKSTKIDPSDDDDDDDCGNSSSPDNENEQVMNDEMKVKSNPIAKRRTGINKSKKKAKTKSKVKAKTKKKSVNKIETIKNKVKSKDKEKKEKKKKKKTKKQKKNKEENKKKNEKTKTKKKKKKTKKKTKSQTKNKVKNKKKIKGKRKKKFKANDNNEDGNSGSESSSTSDTDIDIDIDIDIETAQGKENKKKVPVKLNEKLQDSENDQEQEKEKENPNASENSENDLNLDIEDVDVSSNGNDNNENVNIDSSNDSDENSENDESDDDVKETEHQQKGKENSKPTEKEKEKEKEEQVKTKDKDKDKDKDKEGEKKDKDKDVNENEKNYIESIVNIEDYNHYCAIEGLAHRSVFKHNLPKISSISNSDGNSDSNSNSNSNSSSSNSSSSSSSNNGGAKRKYNVQNNTKKIFKEIRTDLRENIFVSWNGSMFIRFDEEYPYFLQCILCGIIDTPYENGLYIFDIYLDSNYPSTPPQVQHITKGATVIPSKYYDSPGGFSPNLHKSTGKVCLSLLGTWSTNVIGAGWQKGKSNLYQVLSSILFMIFGSKYPYYNEPGKGFWEGNAPKDNHASKVYEYNQELYYGCVKYAMLETLKNPYKGFENIIKMHFKLKQNEIINCVENKWLKICNNTWQEKIKTVMDELKKEFEKL